MNKGTATGLITGALAAALIGASPAPASAATGRIPMTLSVTPAPGTVDYGNPGVVSYNGDAATSCVGPPTRAQAVFVAKAPQIGSFSDSVRIKATTTTECWSDPGPAVGSADPGAGGLVHRGAEEAAGATGCGSVGGRP
jgi:hypothetical protein